MDAIFFRTISKYISTLSTFYVSRYRYLSRFIPDPKIIDIFILGRSHPATVLLRQMPQPIQDAHLLPRDASAPRSQPSLGERVLVIQPHHP